MVQSQRNGGYIDYGINHEYRDVDNIIVMCANVILVNSKCTAVEEHDVEHKPDTANSVKSYYVVLQFTC